jgi:hypothetical protein
MATFTLVHVLLSVVGIGAGFLVVGGLLTGKRLPLWTEVFLATTFATSATGFGFPFEKVLPSHIVGVISIAVLAVAAWALYKRRLVGRWRAAYVVSAVVSLYLNVFVLVAQAFNKVEAFRQAAPTQSEPPFANAQLAVLIVFAYLGVTSVKRFSHQQSEPAAIGGTSPRGESWSGAEKVQRA